MQNNNTNNLSIYILMATYNGEKYLADQLQSIQKQSHNNWKVIISDDGSNDNTIKIATDFQRLWGENRLSIRKGPQKGFCQNFLSLACDKHIKADLYSFCDQDDVWYPNKLERAITYFNSQNNTTTPRGYGSRTEIVDENLKPMGFSPKFIRPSSFRNALVQSIAGGNTQVFNQAAKEILENSGELKVISHDWWLYQLITATGGEFHYDAEPTLLYRQHSRSIIGSNASTKARINRIVNVLNGRFKHWTDVNYTALCNIKPLITIENQVILERYGYYRRGNLKQRILSIRSCGLYRQTWQGTLSLWLAAILNKI